MIARLRDLPLQRKLALLAIVTMASAQLLAAIGLLAWDFITARRVLVQELDTLARVVVDNTAAALSFADVVAAEETLRGLRARPGFANACVYDVQGQLFSEVSARDPCPDLPPADGDSFGMDGVVVALPVTAPGRGRIGTLALHSTLQPMMTSMWAQSAGVAFVLVLSAVAALVLTARFQHLITQPLLELADTAKAVSHDRDYTRRVPKSGNDEIGAVADAVNDMLAQIQTRDAELNRALRLKDEFLATVSHELRTPLNAIVGWVHVFRTPNMPPELASQAAEAIDRNAQRQVRLIEDILDVSRIVTGKLRLEPRAVDLSAIVESAIDVIQPTAAAKEIAVRIDLVRPAPILGDPDRLRQIAWNLLSNAVKFTPRGGRVTVRVAQDRDNYRLDVQDSGPGIAPEFLPHLFEAFRQADGSPTRAHGGLGLGLAIARHLTELSGGRIEATSAGADAGATFTVRLPRPLQAPAPAGDADHRMEDAWQRLDHRAVLLVDDDTDTVKALGALLEAHGADVRTASSAAEARAALAARLPDVLVTDLAMPEEDGYSLLRYCREHRDAALRALPVIALTAYAGEHARVRIEQAGFDAHLAKPIDPATVSRVVATLAARGAAGRVGAATDGGANAG